MCIYHSRFRKLEEERADRVFASKWSAFFIILPCLIALAHGFLLLPTNPGEATHSLLMASFLGLVAVSISSNRRKILQQDRVIQQLQEQLHEANSHSQQSPADDDQKAAPEE